MLGHLILSAKESGILEASYGARGKWQKFESTMEKRGKGKLTSETDKVG